jgi:ribonuclease HI
MAKSDIVVALLEVAVALAETNNDVELADGIEMLEALGDDAKGNTQEYKDLKEVVENIENGLNGDGSEILDEDEKARLEAEEKARLREQELIKQAEIQKDNALIKQKQELEQQNTQVEIKTAPIPSADPNKKIAILTFEFDIKGEVPDEKIIDRIKSQISKDFINYLVDVEVM